PRYLADAAELGLALARLAEVTRDAGWTVQARAIAARLEASLFDPETGAYYAQTADPNAVGVFAHRRQPLEDNVAAARFLAALARVTGEPGFRTRAERVLAAALTPDSLDHQGFWLGGALLALDDIGAVPWPRQ
ncbi:MAG TPA: hypothetical protein VIX73_15815, partial [Kofleriaceae bacterium]